MRNMAAETMNCFFDKSCLEPTCTRLADCGISAVPFISVFLSSITATVTVQRHHPQLNSLSQMWCYYNYLKIPFLSMKISNKMLLADGSVYRILRCHLCMFQVCEGYVLFSTHRVVLLCVALDMLASIRKVTDMRPLSARLFILHTKLVQAGAPFSSHAFTFITQSRSFKELDLAKMAEACCSPYIPE